MDVRPSPGLDPHAGRAVARQCSRPGCADAASATLSYNHGRGAAWLSDLAPSREPHTYDLCAGHADRISVPRGWSLDDRRAAGSSSLATRLAG